MNTTARLLAVAGVLIVAGGAFFLTQNNSAAVPSEQKETQETPATKEFVLKIENKKIVGSDSTLTVTQGDTVVLKITGDEAEEFHIHGYDKSAELEPGVETVLTYSATASGRFPFELEKSGTELGAIEVLPR